MAPADFRPPHAPVRTEGRPCGLPSPCTQLPQTRPLPSSSPLEALPESSWTLHMEALFVDAILPPSQRRTGRTWVGGWRHCRAGEHAELGPRCAWPHGGACSRCRGRSGPCCWCAAVSGHAQLRAGPAASPWRAETDAAARARAPLSLPPSSQLWEHPTLPLAALPDCGGRCLHAAP